MANASPIAVAPGLRERSVLVNSLSKTYSMPGWRTGYAALPAAPLISAMLFWCCNNRAPRPVRTSHLQDASAAGFGRALQDQCHRNARRIYTTTRARYRTARRSPSRPGACA